MTNRTPQLKNFSSVSRKNNRDAFLMGSYELCSGESGLGVHVMARGLVYAGLNEHDLSGEVALIDLDKTPILR